VRIGEGFGHVYSWQVVTVTQAGALARVNVAADAPVEVQARVSFNATTSLVFGVKVAQENVAFTGLGDAITGIGWNDVSRMKVPSLTVDADFLDAQASPGSLVANTDIGGRNYHNAQTPIFLPGPGGSLNIGGTSAEEWILFLEDFPIGPLNARITLWIASPSG